MQTPARRSRPLPHTCPAASSPSQSLPLCCLTFAPPGSHQPGECRGRAGLSAGSPGRKGLATADRKSVGPAARRPPAPSLPTREPGPRARPTLPARGRGGLDLQLPWGLTVAQGCRGAIGLCRSPSGRADTAGAARAPAAASGLPAARASGLRSPGREGRLQAPQLGLKVAIAKKSCF